MRVDGDLVASAQRPPGRTTLSSVLARLFGRGVPDPEDVIHAIEQRLAEPPR